MKSILISLLFFLFVSGQTEYKLNPSESSMVVQGTSTVHDWESKVNDFSVTGDFSESAVTQLKVIVQGESIESGKSIMDKKTYEALETDDHPAITLTAPNLAITGNTIGGQATLSIAGQDKAITISADVLKRTPDAIRLKGSVDIIMSEFGIDPPTAMFGTLKTGDAVTIIYEIELNN